jgi:hypothetical protein
MLLKSSQIMQDYKEEMKLLKDDIKARFVTKNAFLTNSISWLQYVAMLKSFR